MADQHEFLAVRMNPLKLQVGKVADNCGVFYGNNIQLNWRRVVKQNDGFGDVDVKEGRVAENLTHLVDADFLDAPYDATGKEGGRGENNE